ncbi:hypothetical protein ACH4UM_36215 [Streptomyces sp. NPDC020801]|uniref:hypothetical protein n=1 Tax=unclassified Streptomyces TaxID=2593676 RepID=UPI00378AF011
MSETDAAASGLTTQYTAQVAGDLERNLKEQERIAGDITTLQEQLSALQQDHAVLLNIQQALGVTGRSQESSAESAVVAVPAPRKKTAAGAGQGKRTAAKKSAASSRKPVAKKDSAEKPAGSATRSQAGRPTLVELVRGLLAAQREPRSAAELAAALGQQRPEHPVKTTVVRNTLEGLVAKNQAQRTKQGSSVFYTAPDAPEPAAAAEEGQEQPA